jgi:hypothetical protein
MMRVSRAYGGSAEAVPGRPWPPSRVAFHEKAGLLYLLCFYSDRTKTQGVMCLVSIEVHLSKKKAPMAGSRVLIQHFEKVRLF